MHARILGAAPRAANAKYYSLKRAVIPSGAQRNRGTPMNVARCTTGSLPAIAGLGDDSFACIASTLRYLSGPRTPVASRRSAHLVLQSGTKSANEVAQIINEKNNSLKEGVSPRRG
jgi:hypothetical protein